MSAELDEAWAAVRARAPHILTAGASYGWGRVVAWMLDGFDLASPPGVQASGIRSRPEVETRRIVSIESDKGRLVIDTDGAHAVSDGTYAVYQAVTALAERTCERCGDLGTLRDDFGEVLCHPHHEELKGLLGD